MPGSPPVSSVDRGGRGALALLLLASAGSLLLWAALDRRPPDDHDFWYTHHVVGLLNDLRGADLRDALARFGHFVWRESDHPPLASVSTWLAMETFGPSRFVFRLVLLPFLLLLVAGAWATGRELLGTRGGLLVGAVVAGLPSIVNASRKADFVMHAAGIGSVTVALAVAAALRGPRVGLLVGLGFAAGLQLCTHGLSIVHVGALLVGLAVVAWRRWPRPLPKQGVALAVAPFLLLAAPLLGLPWPGAGVAEYALFKYWHFGGQYVVGSGGSALDVVEIGRAAGHAVGALLRHHWMPVPALLLYLPGLLLAPWACLAEARDPGDGRLRDGLRVLGIALVLQLPVTLLTLSHGAVLRDWVGLVVPSTALAVGALVRVARHRPLPARLVAAWPVVLVAHSAFVAYVPALASAAGPDPLADRSAYTGPILGPFATFDGRNREFSHHLVSSHPSVSTRILTAVQDVAGDQLPPPPDRRPPWLLLSHAELRLDVTGCEAPAAGDCCRWEWQDEPVPLGGTQWPFVFGGLAGFTPAEQDRARFVVVLLTLDGVDGAHPWDDPTRLWEWVDDECAATAGPAAIIRMGLRTAAVEPLRDPARWLLPDTDDASTFVGRAVLVDRGTGEVLEW